MDLVGLNDRHDGDERVHRVGSDQPPRRGAEQVNSRQRHRDAIASRCEAGQRGQIAGTREETNLAPVNFLYKYTRGSLHVARVEGLVPSRLNILMLVYPIKAVRPWPAAGLGVSWRLMHFVLLYDMVNKRAPHHEEHLRLIRDGYSRGEIVMAGAVGDPVDGAILAFRGESPDVAERVVQADPYVRQGLVVRWKVKPWALVAGA